MFLKGISQRVNVTAWDWTHNDVAVLYISNYLMEILALLFMDRYIFIFLVTESKK